MSDFEKQIHAMFDHIWDCDINHPIFEDTVGELMDAVIQCYNSLPSSEPEPSTEIQEILNYLDTTLHPIVSPDNWNVYSKLHDMVSGLLYAEPDIVMCRDCMYRGEEPIADGRYWCEIHNTFMYYCSDAERRIDEQ